MPSIIPSLTSVITVGNVANALGNATKNMGGFRGFGGSIPTGTAPISMSQCQKIQSGVGYYNTWQTPNGVLFSTGLFRVQRHGAPTQTVPTSRLIQDLQR